MRASCWIASADRRMQRPTRLTPSGRTRAARCCMQRLSEMRAAGLPRLPMPTSHGRCNRRHDCPRMAGNETLTEYNYAQKSLRSRRGAQQGVWRTCLLYATCCTLSVRGCTLERCCKRVRLMSSRQIPSGCAQGVSATVVIGVCCSVTCDPSARLHAQPVPSSGRQC